MRQVINIVSLFKIFMVRLISQCLISIYCFEYHETYRQQSYGLISLNYSDSPGTELKI